MDGSMIIAVWGSPNSGKTTFATKLATALYDAYQCTAAVLYTDLKTPDLPVIFPNEKQDEMGSVGVPLSKPEIDSEEVFRNMHIPKGRDNLCFLGYRAGENRFTFPKYGRAKVEELLECLGEIAKFVIVDCTSDPEDSVLASVALEKADTVLRLSSPDLKSISFYLSQLPMHVDSAYNVERHIQGINTPNADVFVPIEEVKSHLKEVNFTVPFSQAVKEQMQAGRLTERTQDKRFESRMREIVDKLVQTE